MRKAKQPPKKKGRLKELEHLDVVEVKWIDATSTSRWTRDPASEEPIEAVTLGYLEGFRCDKKYGDFLVLKGSEEETGSKALISSIPVPNITEFRIISRGKKTKNGSK